MNDVTSDPELLGGLSVFTGTRVPFQALFDHLEGGDSLASYPDVPRGQAARVLEGLTRSRCDVVMEWRG